MLFLDIMCNDICIYVWYVIILLYIEVVEPRTLYIRGSHHLREWTFKDNHILLWANIGRALFHVVWGLYVSELLKIEIVGVQQSD